MSTDLYGIKVLELEPESMRTRLRVFVVYYDTGGETHAPLPDDASFFLRVLWDKSEDGPLGREVSVDEICDEAFVDANAYRYVERYERLAACNYPLDSYEGYSDFYYEQDGGWQDEDRLVQADYDIIVTDPKYLAHLVTGMSWGTTAYATTADRLSAAEAAILPAPRRPLVEFVPFTGEKGDAVLVGAAVFSDDGALLALGGDNGEWAVYAVDGWRELLRQASGFRFPRLRFRPGSHQLVITDLHGKQATWDVDSGTPFEVVPLGGRDHSRSGRYLIDYGEDEGLHFLNPDGTEALVLATGQETVEAAAFSPDETLVATGGMHDTVKLWEAASGRLVNTFAVGEWVSNLAFSGDGSYLAVGFGRNLGILRLCDGDFVCRVEFGDYLGALAYAPDDRYLVATNIPGKRDRQRGVAIFAAGRRYGDRRVGGS